MRFVSFDSYLKKWYTAFFIKIMISFFLLGLSQFVFYFYNKSHFDLATESLFKVFLGNIVFLCSSVSIYLSLYICTVLFSFSLKKKKWYRIISDSLWIGFTFLMLFLNALDVFYYPHSARRSSYATMELFLAGADKLGFALEAVKEYWYALASIFVILYLSYVVSKKLYKYIDRDILQYKTNIFSEVVLALITATVFIFGYRGYDKLSLTVVHSVSFVSFSNADIVLNTPFTVIRTWKKVGLVPVHFFDKDKLEQIFDPRLTLPTSKTKLDPELQCLLNSHIKNIVVFNIESLSQEYVGTYSKDETFTPFIDSLIPKTIAYDGFANGKNTISAPVSSLSSIPRFHPGLYLKTIYSTDQIDSVALVLKEKGYDTSFFFGDRNGSMLLDTYAEKMKMDYYGKDEFDKKYPGNKDFDGNWGIFDGPFIKYAASVIDEKYNKNGKPFFAYILTISSHHPFIIPEDHRNKYVKDPNLEISESIGYIDESLKEFFEKVSKFSWYDQTLFIITADHTGMSAKEYYSTAKGKQSVPMIFYLPNSSCIARSDKIVQQVDIFPTVLDLLGIEKSIVSFGRSIFDSKHENIGIAHDGAMHVVVRNNHVVNCFNMCERIEIYDYKKDPLNRNNLYLNYDNLSTEEKENLDKDIDLMKAVIQQYNNRLIENRLIYNKEE